MLVLPFLNAQFAEYDVLTWGYAMTLQTLVGAGSRAAINYQNWPTGSRRFEQGCDIATNAGDTGHFGLLFAIKCQRQIVGKLGRTGTTRTAVDQRQRYCCRLRLLSFHWPALHGHGLMGDLLKQPDNEIGIETQSLCLLAARFQHG